MNIFSTASDRVTSYPGLSALLKAGSRVTFCVFLSMAAVANAQDLIVGSYNNHSVIRYNGTTGAFETVLVPSGSGGLTRTEGLACPGDGNLYVASESTNEVLRYDLETGDFIDVFVEAGSGGLNVASGMAFGPDGDLYVGSYSGDSVLRFDGTTGEFKSVFAIRGGLDTEGVIFGPDGNLYVASYGRHEVVRFNGMTGALMDVFVESESGGLNQAVGLTFGPDGNLYVASEGTNQILRYNGTHGEFIDVFASGGGLDSPFGLIFGPDGNLYVGGWHSSKVHRYNGSTGEYMDDFATGGGLNGAAYLLFCNTETIVISAGLNDAWFNQDTAGQGVFVTVFPKLGKIFIAIFTYDTERPNQGITAILGEPGHRWVTGLGDYSGNKAVIEMELTSGGVFNASVPAPAQMQGYGTATLTFIDCNKLTLVYNFPSLGLSGTMILSRAALDNVALCLALQDE